MRKILRFLMAVAVLLSVAIVPPQVQAQQSMPGMQGAQPALAAASVEGTVKKVNPGARTLEVATGLFGLWGKTLEVTEGTQIQAEGRQATLADIHEGVKVKASYETRMGKSFATLIDLLPTPEPKKATGQPGAATQ